METTMEMTFVAYLLNQLPYVAGHLIVWAVATALFMIVVWKA